MDDAAAFKASFAGLRSLADGDYRISFDFPGHKLREVTEILTQGGKPSAAEGTWFGIARLHTGGTGEDRDESLKSGPHALTSETNSTEGSAPGPVTTPVRSLSQHVHKSLCVSALGRAFVEEFCSDIHQGQKINTDKFAHQVIVRRLGIASLSEVDSDPVASEKAEQMLGLFEGWKRGYDKAS